MRLIFIHGPPASGKLTIGRILSERTGIALFHNHLVVDAVGAVFPFGSEEFIRLREKFWMDMFTAAARSGRSLIFTFASEASVAEDFPRRTSDLVEAAGGEVTYIALTVTDAEQESRIGTAARAEFGKLRSLDLLRELRPSMKRAEAMMPRPNLVIDTSATAPRDAADAIARLLKD
ncbi:AAA family ATPase [Sphingomonas sp. M1-B02]|uniref:AAA family ATPase n=1 Tax=Sphingomonas sp. M1-B02 TaxID=3114300 RepID=UPI0022400D7E|nr:AAA family ATPase [Sphingomonas sp. S6-11]UZK66966.1 AAA family ATPase [Sphingomonas sp. S6-11]